MSVVAMYRVKNEARWIRESIERTLQIADTVLVLDDGSEDGTPEVAAATAEPVMVYEKSKVSNLNWGFDEAKDREFLIKKAAHYNAQWVLAIDGDEVLTPSAIAEMKRILEAGRRGAYFFRVAYLWNQPSLERVDGVYGSVQAPALYAVHSKDPGQLSFKRTEHGGNFHCGRMPASYFFPSYYAPREALIKHYGYMLPEDRERKHAFYRGRDTEQGLANEDGYDHILGKPTRWAPGPVALRPFIDK
jgi:glycosyltransferase involved in cell wall biosynthesis